MLAAAGCGGSSSPKARDGGNQDVIGGEVGPLVPNVLLTVTPPSVDLGTIDVGKKSDPVTVTVTNNGTVASGALSVTVSGTGITATGCSGASLAAKATCQISITAQLAAAGTISGSVEVGDTAANTKKIAVSGLVVPPGQFTLSTNALNLGNVLQGKTASDTVIVTNTANTGLTGFVFAISGAGFTQAGCTDSLPVGQTCNITVTYTAGATSGPVKGSLTVNQNGVTKIVALTATVQTPAKLVITPASASLQTVVGTPSSPVTFYVANSGDLTSAIPTVTITGTNKDDFALVNGCATALAGGGTSSCQVTVTYNPAKAPAVNSVATLTVAEPAGGSSVTAGLTGTAVLPSSLVITGTNDFGTVIVGDTSTALTFTLTNTGGDDSGAIKVSGANQFVIATDNCTDKNLLAKGTCTFTAQFKPAAGDVGVIPGQLRATGASVANPATFAVTGAAVAQAKLTAEPKVLEFGSIPTMQESAPLTLTVSNVGGAPTGALKIDNTGAQFAIKGNTCTGASLTAAGATKTCYIIVTYTPTTSVSDASGTVTITDTTGAAAPVTATLHGAGMVHAALTLGPSIVCPQYDEDDPLCVPTAPPSSHVIRDYRFANKVIGQITDEMTFTLQNRTDPTDSPDSGELTFKIEGEAAADFAIAKNNCTVPLISTGNTPYTSCVLTVTFKPSAAGLRKALLKLNTSRGGAAQATIEGKGLAVVEVQPLKVTKTSTGLSFGQVALGHNDASKNSKPYRIWVRDTTSADKNTTVTVTLPKPNPADFVWPTSSATLTIENGVGPTNGIGLLTPPLGASGSQLSAGGTSTFSSNSATNPCDNKTVSFAVDTSKKPTDATKTGNSPYVYDDDSGYWYCSFGVQFYPQSARGALTADLSGAASGGGTSKVTLTGTATGPLVVNPSPALLQDPVAVGMSANSNLTLTISNEGAVDQKGLTFALSGTGSGDFQIAGTTCWGVNSYPAAHAYEGLPAVTLTAGASCYVWLGFEPKTEGPYSVTFTATAANGAGATDDEAGSTTIIANGSKTYGALTVTQAAAFADVPFKKTDAAPVTFTVKNNGTLDATNLNYSVSSTDFTVLPSVGVAGACSVTTSFVLAGGASCTIQVRPTPTSNPIGIGKKLVTGSLTVDSTPGGAVVAPMIYYETSNIMVANGGTAASSVSFTFEPAGLLSNVDHNFVVSNLSSSAVSLATSVAAPFLVRENVEGLSPAVCAFGTNSLAAGASCTLVVRNNNITVGVIAPEHPTVLLVRDSASTDDNAEIRLSSTTLAASVLEVYGLTNSSGTPIDLGTVPIDTSTSNYVGGMATVWFRNVGQVATKALTARWDLTAPTTASAATDAEFIVDGSDNCLGKALAPNAMCSMTVHFKPNTTVRSTMLTREAQLVLVDSNPAGVPVFFKATPTLAASVYIEDVTANPSKFGFFQFTQITPSGGTAVSPEIRTFRITKATSGGTQAISLAGLSAPFVLAATSPTDSCGESITLNDADPSCQFNVVFKPESTGNVFQFGTIQPGGDAVLGLMGRMQQAVTLDIQQAATSASCASPADCVDFGIVAVGGTKTQTLTVVNLGDLPMDPNAAALTASVAAGDPGASFTTTGGDLCTGVRLKAYGTSGDRCVMTVTATGTSGLLTSTAILTVGTATYNMQAEVFKAANAIITGNNVFANAAVTGYTEEIFTITNGDSAEYVPTGVVTASLTGAQADQFTVVGNTCPPNVGLDSNESCTVTVRFTPNMLSSNGNAFTATLNVAATPGGPKTTTLQGTPNSALTISPPGTGPAVPATYTLASANVGITFTVTKEGTAVATAPLKTSITGTDFMLVDDLCYGEILSGSGSDASCKLTVKYIGRSTSTEKKATITINGGSEGQSVSIIVSHTGDEASTH